MKSMSHPDFQYMPWSKERRERAALAAKKRIRLERAIELTKALDRRTRGKMELLRLLYELKILI